MQGPFAVYLNANPLQSYSGGILSSTNCGSKGINHGVFQRAAAAASTDRDGRSWVLT